MPEPGRLLDKLALPEGSGCALQRRKPPWVGPAPPETLSACHVRVPPCFAATSKVSKLRLRDVLRISCVEREHGNDPD